jgi:capsular exopolysaccharide synthesis family protein
MPDESSNPSSPRILSQERTDAPRWKGAVADELVPMLVNLREPIALMRRRWRLVLLIAAGITGVVAFLAYSATPSFRAIAVIRFSDPRRALTGGVADGPARGGFDRYSADPLLSQVELLQSRTVAGVVVDSMPILRVRSTGLSASDLADLQLAAALERAGLGAPRADSLVLWFTADSMGVQPAGEPTEIRVAYGDLVQLRGLRFRILAPPGGSSGRGPRDGTLRVLSRAAGIAAVTGGLRVTPRPRTDVIDVAYVASDPHRAQEVVNQVVQVFRAVSAEETKRESRLRRQFLEVQLRINDSVLASARNALSSFRQRAGRVGGSSEGSARAQVGAGAGASSAASADQLQLQREQFDADRRLYRGILTSLAESRDSLRAAVSLPGISGSMVVSQLYTQLIQYETTRDSLTARAPVHPDLPRLNELIATTERQLLRAVQSAATGLAASLDSRIASLDRLRARRSTDAQQLSATDAEEARLVERVENARQIADQLRIEYQRARIAEAVEVGQVEIVDLATTPGSPLGIGLLQKVTLGLLLGLLLGGGSAFLAEHLGSAVGRREDLEALGLSLLSAVPRCRDARNPKRPPQGSDPAIEAFRGLRMSLMHAYGSAGGGPIAFAITSPGSRDGKSFVSANLALALANANVRTLLIDGDGRRGTLHRALSGLRRPGLTDVLSGDAKQADIIQNTTFRGLYFIGCGTRRSDGPELLGSERMTELFSFLRGNFQAIIVDTPPLGAGVDAFALATAAGSLLMVLRPGIAERELLAAKLEQLRHLPVRLLGAVLNDVQEGPEYRAYSYYLEGYEARAEPAERHRPVLRAMR